MVELNRELLLSKPRFCIYKSDDLVQVRIEYKSINKINVDTFKGFRNLESISMECNVITEIDGRLFDGLSNLSELNLKSNSL